MRWAHGSGCLDRGVVPPGRTTPRGRVGGRGQHRLWDVVTPGRIPRRGLVWSGGVWVGRWGGSGCGGLMGRVVWTVGWFLPAVPHPVVVWEVVVNTDCGMWSHRDGFPGVVWCGVVWWFRGGTDDGVVSGCGGFMGWVVWTLCWADYRIWRPLSNDAVRLPGPVPRYSLSGEKCLAREPSTHQLVRVDVRDPVAAVSAMETCHGTTRWIYSH